MASIVLLSGGKDSVECLKRATPPVTGLYVEQGSGEYMAAMTAAKEAGVYFMVRRGNDFELMDNGRVKDLEPGRNTRLLSLALSIAEQEGQDEIWLGAQAEDQGLYPDCSPEFLAAFEKVASISAERPIRIRSLLDPCEICGGGGVVDREEERYPLDADGCGSVEVVSEDCPRCGTNK